MISRGTTASALVILAMLVFASTPVGAHGTVDQSFTGTPTNAFEIGNSAGAFLVGQTFRPTVSNLIAVDLFLGVSSETCLVTVEIREGSFAGPLLGTTSKLVGTIMGQFVPVHFDFTTQVPLTPGDSHVVRATAEPGPTGLPRLCVQWALTDGPGATYPGGSFTDMNGVNENLDFLFATYFAPQEAIDIKPGSDPNSINCDNGRGVIAVAILTTDDFDATTVDHETVLFEGASETHMDKKSGDARRHAEDVDGDGDTDLVFHFRLGDTGLTCDSTEGTLTGSTFGGQAFELTDSVRMVPPS